MIKFFILVLICAQVWCMDDQEGSVVHSLERFGNRLKKDAQKLMQPLADTVQEGMQAVAEGAENLIQPLADNVQKNVQAVTIKTENMHDALMTDVRDAQEDLYQFGASVVNATGLNTFATDVKEAWDIKLEDFVREVGGATTSVTQKILEISDFIAETEADIRKIDDKFLTLNLCDSVCAADLNEDPGFEKRSSLLHEKIVAQITLNLLKADSTIMKVRYFVEKHFVEVTRRLCNLELSDSESVEALVGRCTEMPLDILPDFCSSVLCGLEDMKALEKKMLDRTDQELLTTKPVIDIIACVFLDYVTLFHERVLSQFRETFKESFLRRKKCMPFRCVTDERHIKVLHACNALHLELKSAFSKARELLLSLQPKESEEKKKEPLKRERKVKAAAPATSQKEEQKQYGALRAASAELPERSRRWLADLSTLQHTNVAEGYLLDRMRKSACAYEQKATERNKARYVVFATVFDAVKKDDFAFKMQCTHLMECGNIMGALTRTGFFMFLSEKEGKEYTEKFKKQVIQASIA